MQAAQVAGGITVMTMLIAGCGGTTHAVTRAAGSVAVARGTSSGLPLTADRPSVQPIPASTPTPAPVATPPAPTPVPRPSYPSRMASSYLALRTTAGNGQDQLQIVAPGGAVVASVSMQSTAAWSYTVGSHAVYWIDDGTVHSLSIRGAMSSVATVPVSVTAMLVSPDGSSYAYATSTPTSSSADAPYDNRIYVQRFGAPAHVLADRLSDPSHPTSDAPTYWDYYLIRWTDQGILFARVNQGGCGCGPFDMEMQSAYSAIIDPATGTTSPLTSDTSCPLSGLGPSSEAACFARPNGSSGVSALRVEQASHIVDQFGMSGQNVAGDAIFSKSGDAVAYVTVPAVNAGCGSTWPTTVHVLQISSSQAQALPIDGLHLVDWSDPGQLIGVQSTESSVDVIAVNPKTMSVASLWTGPSTATLLGLLA